MQCLAVWYKQEMHQYKQIKFLNMKQITDLLKFHSQGQSDFQNNFFVTEKSSAGTVYGALKQSLRELDSRYNNYQNQLLELEKEEIKIHQKRIEGKEDSYKGRLAKVSVKEKTLKIEGIKKGLLNTEREMNTFYRQASYFKDAVGDLTEKDREVLEEEFWMARFKELAVLDLVTMGRMSSGTYELLLSLPVEMKNTALTLLSSPDDMIKELEQRTELVVPKSFKALEVDLTELKSLK